MRLPVTGVARPCNGGSKLVPLHAMPGIARSSTGDLRRSRERTQRNSRRAPYGLWFSFDIRILVFRTTGCLYGLAHHDFGPCAVLVVKLQQPSAVASVDAGFFRRFVAAIHHRLIDVLNVQSADADMMPDAELLRRWRTVVLNHVLDPVIAIGSKVRNPVEAIVTRAALPKKPKAQNIFI